MRAVIYARVSTEQEEQRTSIPTQLERCRQYCQLKGWAVASEHTDYRTGRVLDRAGFNAAVAALRSGEAQVLVAATLDRIARTVDFMKFLRDEIQARGADISTIDGGFDTTTASGRFLLSVLLSSYQYQVEQSGEKLRSALALKRQRGELVSGRPFGTRRDPQLKRRVRDDSTYPVLLEIFKRAASGEPRLRIANDLNRRGIPTVENRRWQEGTVRSMLNCRWYIGEIVHRDEVVATGIEHDCLVPRELWLAAQQTLSKGRPVIDYIFLLNGLLVSSEYRYTVPASMAGDPVAFRQARSKGKYLYKRMDSWAGYYAAEPVNGARLPTYFHAPELEQRIVQAVIDATADSSLLTRARQGAADQARSAAKQAERTLAELRKAEREHERLEAALLRALDTAASEAIRALNQQTADSRQRCEQLATQLAEQRRDAASTPAVIEPQLERLHAVAELWRAGKRAELKLLLAALIDYVDLHADSAEIYFKPLLCINRIREHTGSISRINRNRKGRGSCCR